MPRYAAERKAAVLGKLLPPHNRPVPEVAQAEGISAATLYTWLQQAKEEGVAVPGSGKASPEQWNGEAKLAVVIATASMTASEVSDYCRSKGLYPEQITRWKQDFIASVESAGKSDSAALKHSQKTIRQLEKDLRRKEKALAESAALLVLQKKFNALWEDAE